MNEFEKRLLDMVEETYNISEQEHEEVLKMYRDSRNNIRQFLADVYMEYGNNGQLDIADLRNNGVMDQIQNTIQEETQQIAESESSMMPVILASVFSGIYYKTAYQMESSFNIEESSFAAGIDFNLLNQQFIDSAVNHDWSGIPFSERIWSNRDALVNSLRTEITRGIVDGDSIDKMAKRLNKQFNSKAYQSKRLMVTETARVVDAAQQQIYKDTGIVKKLQWMATLEENTCPECASLDGKRFELDNSSKPSIPRHPHCKCAYIGVPFADYSPEKRKNNQNKQVESYKTFEEWANSKNIPS